MICCCTLANTESCKNCINNNKTNSSSVYKTYFTPEMYTIDYYKQRNKKKKPTIQFWCPNCDALLNKYDKFCHNCGNEIDWEEVE